MPDLAPTNHSPALPRVLVVTAVDREAAGLARWRTSPDAAIASPGSNEHRVADPWPAYTARLPGGDASSGAESVAVEVDVVIAGIGRANAAGATAAALARGLDRVTGGGRGCYQAVINAGIAGSLGAFVEDATVGAGHDGPAPSNPAVRVAGPEIGEVVIATASVFFEEGIDLPGGPADMRALGFELGLAPWAYGNRIRVDTALADRLAASLQREGTVVHRGAIATVARCSGTDQWARAVQAQSQGAIAEAMEGAAVALVAGRFGVPFAELRVISNTCGDRPRQRWNIRHAFAELDRLLPIAVRAAACVGT